MNEFGQKHWKQQHLNNSCPWACLAMLFSRWGIQTEDRELVSKSLLPYLLQHHEDEDDDWISAGMGCQSVDVFNLVSAPFGMQCIEHRLPSWVEYRSMASGLLRQQTPFMTSVSAKTIPTPAYEKLRENDMPDNGHAIVVFHNENNTWYALDPSADLDRNRKYCYAEIADRVRIVMNDEMFEAGNLHTPGIRFILMKVKPGASEQLPAISSWLAQSHQALTVFRTRMEDLLSVMQSPSSRVSTVFEDCLFRYIKSVALDLRVAVETIAPKNADQLQLCRVLQEFQDVLVSTQKALRAGETIKSIKIDKLSAISELVSRLTEQHLGCYPNETTLNSIR